MHPRATEESDLVGIASVAAALAPHRVGPGAGALVSRWKEPDYRRFLEDPRCLLRVVARGDQVVGFALVFLPEAIDAGPQHALNRLALRHAAEGGETMALVKQVGVHPDAQGLGLGRALYEDVLACLPDVQRLYAAVVEGNAASAGFHRALGFTSVIEGFRYPGDPRPRQLWMRRGVSPWR